MLVNAIIEPIVVILMQLLKLLFKWRKAIILLNCMIKSEVIEGTLTNTFCVFFPFIQLIKSDT